MAGVTIALVGDRTGTQIAHTNASGNYALSYGANNRLTVIASRPGYLFSPLSVAFISNRFLTGNWNASFTATTFPIPFPVIPVLLTEENVLQALALESATLIRDPFPVVTTHNFSSDQRGRVMLFAVNVALNPGENLSAITATAENSQRSYSLPVEFVGRVPGYNWLTQVAVKLPEELGSAVEVWVSINVRGAVSNKVLIKVKSS
jgi:hypothetical protein